MRTILHFDIDAFFASVEQNDHPEYKGKPLIVGGRTNRGVVATCSYEARKYGVHSAMSIVTARKLCPDGIYVSGHMSRYSEISKAIFGYIRGRFDCVQQVSIDEAYIDVTQEITEGKESPIKIAQQIKKDVYDQTGLTISVGISYNKFLAKLASDWNKPNGIFVIRPEDVPDLLLPLPIIKIHGLGKKSCERLNRIGIFNIEDLYKYPKELLYSILGESWAAEIIDRIHGIDNRSVHEGHERKSYGRETTFKADIFDREEIYQTLERYFDQICGQLQTKNLLARTVTVKIKYHDFEQFTKSYSLHVATDDLSTLKRAFERLFYSIELEKPVRLAGVTLSNIEDGENKQYSFLESFVP